MMEPFLLSLSIFGSLLLIPAVADDISVGFSICLARSLDLVPNLLARWSIIFIMVFLSGEIVAFSFGILPSRLSFTLIEESKKELFELGIFYSD